MVAEIVSDSIPGFLFRAQPTLLTAESSAHIMDEIFNSDDDEAKSRLLKIMQEFLISEAEKHATLEKEKGNVSLCRTWVSRFILC